MQPPLKMVTVAAACTWAGEPTSKEAPDALEAPAGARLWADVRALGAGPEPGGCARHSVGQGPVDLLAASAKAGCLQALLDVLKRAQLQLTGCGIPAYMDSPLQLWDSSQRLTPLEYVISKAAAGECSPSSSLQPAQPQLAGRAVPELPSISHNIPSPHRMPAGQA